MGGDDLAHCPLIGQAEVEGKPLEPVGPQAGGGAMHDLGLPLMDLALWLTDYPKTVAVSAHYGPARTNGDVEQDASVFIRCEDGPSIFVDVSWNHVGDREMLWLDMVGSHGSAGIGPLRVFKEINGRT